MRFIGIGGYTTMIFKIVKTYVITCGICEEQEIPDRHTGGRAHQTLSTINSKWIHQNPERQAKHKKYIV